MTIDDQEAEQTPRGFWTGLPREAAYYGIALAVAFGFQWMAWSHGPRNSLWSLFGWFAAFAVGVLVASRGRKTFHVSLVVFLCSIMAVGTAAGVLQYRKTQRTNAVRAAEVSRQTLIERNGGLPVGESADLTEALLSLPPKTHVRVTLMDLRLDLGHLPTASVLTKKEYLRMADSGSLDQGNPDPHHVRWTLERKSHQWRMRAWYVPDSDEMTIGAELLLRNDSSREVRFPLNRFAVVKSGYSIEDSSTDAVCRGWLSRSGKFGLNEVVYIPAGGAIRGYAVFVASRGAASENRTLVLAGEDLRFTYADDTGKWVPDEPTYDLYGGPGETYAASWELPSSYARWTKVGDMSGVGIVGDYDSDLQSRSSHSFFLTGGPVKLKWTLARPVTPGGSGPYLFGSIEPVGSMSLWHTFMNPVLETDFYHASSMTLSDGQQAGRYRLSVAGLNCRWRLELWQKRWQ